MTAYTAPNSETQDESSKMKVVYFSNEFPHDDLRGLLCDLYTLSKSSRYPILARFLDDSTLAVRDEIRQLPASLATLFPPFENFLSLAAASTPSQVLLSSAVDSILLCVVELGTLIG